MVQAAFALWFALNLDPALNTNFALRPPCLGCRVRTSEPANDPVPTAPAPAPAKQKPLAIGDTWQLGKNRALSIHLTPTPEECAPLVRLTF